MTKCHACHAKCRSVTGDQNQPKRATQCHKCHACHVKPTWMWPSATPATWNEGGCHLVPRLPLKVPRRHGRPKPAQVRHPVPYVPRLPRKTKMDVRLCHACHAKCRGKVPRQSAAASRATKTSPSAPPSAISATPATWNQRGCDQVPRLPRETKVDVTLCRACHSKCRGVTGDQNQPKCATQCHTCHACHAKRRWMWDCATPATQSAAAKCRGVTGDQNQPKRATQCHKCHACHAKRRWMSPCATPADNV